MHTMSVSIGAVSRCTREGVVERKTICLSNIGGLIAITDSAEGVAICNICALAPSDRADVKPGRKVNVIVVYETKRNSNLLLREDGPVR